MQIQEKTIFDFTDPSSIREWNIINDGVMGGISSSTITHDADGKAIFSGHVSLENNGGFASTRTSPRDHDLTGYDGIRLRVKGDGKRYKFRIRTDDNFDGVTYSADFFAPYQEWKEVYLNFSEFKPTFRGRLLPNVPPLPPSQIRQMGFLISDKQEGRFILEIDWIRAVGNG